jgi:hypothetical protein
LLNNIILLVTIDKFEFNLVLVNISKLKPYKFIEDKTLELVLVKLGDLVIDKPIQAGKHVPLLVELEDFQLVEFEPVSNHLTLGSIKSTNVHVHHYHNLLIQDNNVTMNNDPNDVYGKALIDVYLLGVFNPKGCVHSQPHSHFYMKQYKELLHSSFCLFVFIFFFILTRAMSESALERPRQEAR